MSRDFLEEASDKVTRRLLLYFGRRGELLERSFVQQRRDAVAERECPHQRPLAPDTGVRVNVVAAIFS